MPTILRAGRGMTLWENARLDPPSKKLELFSYENNPVQQFISITCVNRTVSLYHEWIFSLFIILCILCGGCVLENIYAFVSHGKPAISFKLGLVLGVRMYPNVRFVSFFQSYSLYWSV